MAPFWEQECHGPMSPGVLPRRWGCRAQAVVIKPSLVYDSVALKLNKTLQEEFGGGKNLAENYPLLF